MRPAHQTAAIITQGIRAMKNSTAIVAAMFIWAVNISAPVSAEPPAKQLTIDAGKGVSFQLGKQTRMALFTQEAAACGLSVSISASAAQDGMSGMAGMSGDLAAAASKLASTLKVKVLPGQPARLSTPDGRELIFNCGPDAKQMFFDMPADFKYSDKN